ncbi:MAG: alpha/beta hydrolase [Sedimenticola sp.]
MYLKSLLLLLGLLTIGVAQAEEVKLSHNGITLNANLETTGEGWESAPVILMTHGTLAHSRMEIMAGLQEMLLERGVSSLSINLSLGLDDRQAAMYPCETPHRHLYNDAEGEIGAWVDWLKGQGAGRISLLGHSRGGNQTARYAAAQGDAGVETVFLLAPSLRNQGYGEADYKRRYGKDLMPILQKVREMTATGRGEDLLQKVDFIYCKETSVSAAAFVSNYEPEKDGDTPSLVSRTKSPVLIIVGSEDKVVSGLAEKMEPMVDGERVQMITLEGAGHFFLDLYSEEVADTIAETLGIE